jgi:hypothetical protein
MATITLNGGITITPGKIPGHIEAKRELEVILQELERVHRTFLETEISDIKSSGLLKDTKDIKERYGKVLASCANAVEEWSGKDSELKSYYEPLSIFLYRSSDAHTLMPFDRYIGNLASGIIPQSFGKFEFKEFVGSRIEESISTCKAYTALLSQTMNEEIERVDISGLVSKAFGIAKSRARYKSGFYDSEESRNVITKIITDDTSYNGRWDLTQQHPDYKAMLGRWQIVEDERSRVFDKSKAASDYSGAIYSFEPMLFFYLINTFGNHFKAAHEYKYQMLDGYKKETETPAPQVNAKIERRGEHHIAITSKDNGVGIQREVLETLFNPKPNPNDAYDPIFVGFLMGNHSTLRTYPLVCDLIGAQLTITSEGRFKGTKYELILPISLDKPRQYIHAN